MRGIAQIISYEISLIVILLSFVIISGGYRIKNFGLIQINVEFIFLFGPLLFI
jgi:NADH:ubiquinone oxidoreductase subunit H